MIFGKILNGIQQNGAAFKPSSGTTGAGVPMPGGDSEGASLEITNVWSGPIIILSNESQLELEKHYLSYSSKIPAESFEAIFGDKECGEF